MDGHNQQSSQRVQDRPMSHSTASQHQPPPPFPPFNHPPTAQPPIQIPFSDPFQNRDPFMPSSAHSRRGSYGIAPGQGSGGPPSYGERAWSAQPADIPRLEREHPIARMEREAHYPPAPPPPTAHASMNPCNHIIYPYESSRRRSIGGAGSPPRYPAGSLDALPPPPPPSFASRTMPPPSPTTTAPPNSSFPVPAPRPPPSASPFAGVRDLSAFASRSGPSMSISSLIGGESSRHGNHSPRTTATAPSPTIKPMHPPSPHRARSASIRTDQQYARPESPANNPYAPRPHESRGPPLPPNHTRPPPEHPQTLPPQPPPPFAPSNLGAFRPFQSSPSSMHGDEPSRHSAHAPPPPRPNSQPMQPPPQEQEQRHRHEPYDPATRHPGFRHFNEHVGRSPATSQPPSQPHPNDRDRTEGPHESSLNGHVGPPPQHRMSPRPSQTARSTPAPNGQSMGRNTFNPPYREEQHAALFRPSFNPYSQPPPPPQAPNGHREDLDYRGPRTEMFGRAIGEHRQSPTPSELARFDAAYRGPPAHYGPYGPHPYDGHANEQQHHRREDELHHRSLLGVSADMARKNGRSSPLPQAVQGAQLRHVGPAADPSIKSEFGRMFPGLGLGVGSNTPIAGMSANGSATPSRMSPARQLERHETPGVDLDAASNASRGNKRGRKAKEDHLKDDADGSEATATATPNMGHQSSKKVKAAHPPPHHHHHHAHHHHHHHHNLAEEAASAGPSSFNTLRFPANPTVPQPPPAPHHHHHHHAVHAHPPHHHHHTQKALPAPRQPDITVSNQALLSSISHRPRKHLGSELYATKLGLPPRDSTPLDAKFHFRSRMKLLPRFEGKENCTFTIRVPRAYLASTSTPEDEQNAIAGGLEEICRTRAIWGAEVYTDDSDVVAAAVHSGWLCGDFGEYNDDIHEIFGEEFADQTNASLGNIISEKPKTPVRPIPNSDLHVTVLVVPPLTSYAATTQHHLRSRGWGCDHDGMSIMIHSLQFVNEAKTNRFTERGGAAKHQRIADDLKRREEAAESLVGLLKGGNSVSVGA